MKLGLWLVIICTLIALHALAAENVTILRDSFGIPSIEAESLDGALYGLGYAMTEDTAVQMARNFKLARGRMAEVDGRGQLAADIFLRSLGIEDLAKQKAGELQEPTKGLLQSFVRGANKRLAEDKKTLPNWIEPFTVEDVLATVQLVNAAFPLLDIAGQLLPGTGSNQFVIGKSRSTTGGAILSLDPHLEWGGFMSWYEFSLYAREDDISFRGITFCGLPFGAMGHTDKIAWCMTNNNPDLYDFFVVKTKLDDSSQYNYHGEWAAFENSTFEVRYLEEGEMRSQRVTSKRTRWGPMVPLRNQALALSMIGDWTLLDQFLKMLKSKNASELRAAINAQGLSMWNLVYADSTGNIGYQYNAMVPKRDSSFDWTKPVDGADPKSKWGERWKPDDLPHFENPKSGLLVNCNSDPTLTPIGQDSTSLTWPDYVTSYGKTTRYNRLAFLLSHDSSISPEEAMRYATDTEVPFALATVNQLQRESSTANGKLPGVEKALEVLFNWDGRADPDSDGCTLYWYWLQADKDCAALSRVVGTGSTWTAEQSSQALSALGRASSTMTTDLGSLAVKWGEFHTISRGDKSAGVSGFGFPTAVVPNNGTFKSGKLTCTAGSSFRMIVHLQGYLVESWSIHPYGNSTNSTSSHFSDQMELFGNGEYKPTSFGLDAAKKSAVNSKVLQTTD